MIAATLLGCAVLSTQGWELRDLGEAGISLMSPAPFRLISAGSASDSPQSVERSAWRSEGGDVALTVSYERWRTPHFAPSASLEIFARRTLGMSGGAAIQPIRMGSVEGAILLVHKSDGVSLAVLRAKANDEAWQIEVRPQRGPLDPAVIERVRESVSLAAVPEEAGAYDVWGNLTARVEPAPAPRPGPRTASPLASARIALYSPIELQEKPDLRTEAEKQAVEALSEWQGSSPGAEVAVSYFRLKGGQTLDLGGWVASYGSKLRDEGLSGFSPSVEELKIKGAQGRIIRGRATLSARPLSVLIVLISRGQECWAIQARLAPTGSSDVEKDILSTLKLLP